MLPNGNCFDFILLTCLWYKLTPVQRERSLTSSPVQPMSVPAQGTKRPCVAYAC